MVCYMRLLTKWITTVMYEYFAVNPLASIEQKNQVSGGAKFNTL